MGYKINLHSISTYPLVLKSNLTLLDSVYETSSLIIEEGEECYNDKAPNGLVEELGYLK